MNTVVSYLPGTPAPTADGEIARVFAAQQATALRWRSSTTAERRVRIRRLLDAVMAHREAFYEAGARDFNKPPAEVDSTELLPVIAEARHALRALKGWMKPQRVWPSRITLGTQSWIRHEPRGRCLIISPWNYPVNLTFGPLVSCLAAGNTAILKPSEMTPHLSALMTRIVREIFSSDEVAIFEGDASVSTTLLTLPFDHIFFTGSPAIGKVVMAAAARHLTSVTLELGGKSPTIVDETADLAAAARAIVWGKYTNNGQTCIAPDYVLVHDSVREAFVEACRSVIRTAYGDGAEAQKRSGQLARIVNARHTQRLQGLLDDARERGARVLVGGESSVDECFIQPTLLDRIPAEARIQTEEIFGPLLPIVGYTDLDDAIAQINAQPKPLALYIWSRRQAHIDRVLQQTSAGGTCINQVVLHYAQGNLPFGGVNNSGIGNAHGEFGFRAFSHQRAVLRGRVNTVRLLYPPYTKLTQRLLAVLMRFS